MIINKIRHLFDSTSSQHPKFIAPIWAITGPVFKHWYRIGSSLVFFTRHYGAAGPVLCIFGNLDVWRIELQVLQSTNDQESMDFKKSMQDESHIIAIAGTILAQITITALSLENLSETHWIARAFFTFSLSSSLMAVYYATRQYRTFGRCYESNQIKTWIKAGTDRRRLSSINLFVSQLKGPPPVMPSAASVLSVSAPHLLLEASLNSFLIGFAVYLCLIWKKNLDTVSGPDHSRAVFITYIVGLAFCFGVYMLSDAVAADQNYISEFDLLHSADQIISGEEHDSTGNIPEVSVFATIPVPMQSTSLQSTVSASPSNPAELKKEENSIFTNHTTREELLAAFSEAAKLRKESAKLDERIAELLAALK
ncbi:hypothetical protein P154DRAFT_497657 [Amniculicola lignicola CBS 123094]|uniref:Uncharacterized protein n=1 Tax=Amniculicola lignicola CBS 123094 TaxID=1392246 RepID=A0A6A5W6N3_9PLEO|nr:hypothetical protein P154DRAFT_497657 [Amniculicola lignicola CBS 123094]